MVSEAARVLTIEFPELSDLHRAVGYKAKAPLVTLEVDPDTAGKVTTLKEYGDFAVLVRADDEPAESTQSDGDYSLLALLGIDEAPPPPPVWTVEKYQGRARFPASPDGKIVANTGPTRLHVNDIDGVQHWGYRPAEPGVTVGLAPTGRPTANFDLSFREHRFTRAVPQFGGFDPADGDEVLGELPPDDAAAEVVTHERFDRIYENNFKTTTDHPLSTFSIDVDTASYSKVRQFLSSGRLPPPDAVRIEELVNYFPYDYLPPMGADPFTAHMEVCECPWKPQHRLARIAIKGQVMEVEDRPHSNLVFLLDVSGSMNQENKLPLVKKGMKMLVERLGEKDRVAIVTYAGNAGLVLDSTTCDEKAAIMKAIDELQPGGSTAGAAGLTLAYEIARKHFIEKGVNRVLLCTDGDFNVGVSDNGGLVRLAEEQAQHNVFSVHTRLWHGQPERLDAGAGQRQGQRHVRLHRYRERSPQGARRATQRHAGDDCQGREDSGRVQSGQGEGLPPNRLREPHPGRRGFQR